ncbi:hypothetical protein [Paenibacillus sp. USHLN196]|uniref:hypothetical protein n=1 Tax=Paenibacillus sp. USHLN196 TaxID=3081291 RepID=UPI003019B301
MSKFEDKEFSKVEAELNKYWDAEFIDVDQANKIASYCQKLLSSLKIANITIRAINSAYEGEGTDIQAARKMALLANSYLNEVKYQ